MSKTMQWLADYRADIRRYTAYSKGPAAMQLLFQQGLWALLQYRIAAAVYTSRLPGPARRALLVLLLVWQKAVEVATGISLPYTAVIGPGLYIGHFGNIIINGRAVIGPGCNISQGVTIGVSGRGAARGVPAIGARVYIGANAVIAGNLTVGDDAVIGAASLVTQDVPPGCTVVGVPAVVVSSNNSAAYLAPEDRE